ncbi:MAG: chorismate mutase, partial [Anaerolineae bacterium]|nr:chorismate mutase [Anaerolineae bacterium]
MMPEDSLQELRSQVDEINLQILDLLSQRARLASEIGKVQQQMGTSFYDPEREAQMLTLLEQTNNGPFSNETIKALFREIFRASLALEEKEARQKIRVQRKSPDEHTVITLADGFQIGNGDFSIISGPCAVESYEQMDETASALAEHGVRVLRG